jgi:glycosyltransferase involved in cell wall biosynthesis
MRRTVTRTGSDVSPRRPAHNETALATITAFHLAPRTPAGVVIDVSVVIPAYNEQNRIGPTLEQIRAYLHGRQLTWEVVVVDDGSADRTVDVVRTAMSAERRIRLLRSPRNRGKGYAVREGVRATVGDRILVCDADLSAPIEELERLWTMSSGAVAAIGSRSDPSRIEVHQNRVREVLGRLGNRLIRRFADLDVADTQCGFKLFEGYAARALFALATVDRWAFDVEILHLCSRFGWRVDEVPVRWAHVHGSKIRPFAYLTSLLEVASLRMRHRGVCRPDIRRGAAAKDLSVFDRLAVDRRRAEVA